MPPDPKYLGIPNISFSLTEPGDKRDAEFSKQRIARGFDDSETWSLRDTIANFIIPRLTRYEELAGEVLIREQEQIDKIASFKRALELIARDQGIAMWTEEENKQIEEGLNAFPEIFLDLWW